jgi:hypothetical protein
MAMSPHYHERGVERERASERGREKKGLLIYCVFVCVCVFFVSYVVLRRVRERDRGEGYIKEERRKIAWTS